MTNNASHWAVLKLTADMPVREIISAYLSPHFLGAVDLDNQSRYFFTPAQKSSIDAMIRRLKDTRQFKWEWATQNRKDWHLAWKDSFKPVFISDQLAVIPEWDTQTEAPYIIRIKPGNAFGTGHHETTALVLEQLPELLKPGMSVLDIGTGSGILAIAAKLLGAAGVTCLEIDPSCETNFYENVHLNGLDGQLIITPADVLNWTDFSYDLLLVNVSRNVILDLLPLLKTASGYVLLTGILNSDVDRVEQRCSDCRFQVCKRTSKGEWACLRIKKMRN